MNPADLIPSAREMVFLIVGVFIGTFGLFLAALMSAAGRVDDFDEKYRGVRRS